VRTLLIDDHEIFTQGLEFILSDLDESMEFLRAGLVDEALALDDKDDVDLILLDFHMPGLHGLDALAAVKEAFQSAVIVMLSSEDDPHTIRDVVRNGASGFIPKSSKPELLIAALKLVLAGGPYLPAHVLSDIPERKAPVQSDNDAGSRGPIDALSERQRDVFMKVAQGKINKVIAYELDISVGTVKFHLSNALQALGLKNRYDVVFYAAKMGLTEANPE
jgi:DNA-binding NarL/FixJ family response regulator